MVLPLLILHHSGHKVHSAYQSDVIKFFSWLDPHCLKIIVTYHTSSPLYFITCYTSITSITSIVSISIQLIHIHIHYIYYIHSTFSCFDSPSKKKTNAEHLLQRQLLRLDGLVHGFEVHLTHLGGWLEGFTKGHRKLQKIWGEIRKGLFLAKKKTDIIMISLQKSEKVWMGQRNPFITSWKRCSTSHVLGVSTCWKTLLLVQEFWCWDIPMAEIHGRSPRGNTCVLLQSRQHSCTVWWSNNYLETYIKIWVRQWDGWYPIYYGK